MYDFWMIYRKKILKLLLNRLLTPLAMKKKALNYNQS